VSARWPAPAILALVIATLRMSAAQACNLCIEDKIAATYDWQLAQRAARAGHVVVFAEIHGPVRSDDDGLQRDLAKRLSALPGVDPGSVRISLAPPAASFACAPGGQTPRRLVAAVSKAIAPRGLWASLIRVGAPGTTPSTAAAAR
jgi:hypothetical protein